MIYSEWLELSIQGRIEHFDSYVTVDDTESEEYKEQKKEYVDMLADGLVGKKRDSIRKGVNKTLKKRNLFRALNKEVIDHQKPFLGICLGMQLICKESFEFGHHEGFGWIEASVRKLELPSPLRIPHVGWNNLIVKIENRLIDFQKSNDDRDVYFVHSYYVDAGNAPYVTATCEYGAEFPVALESLGGL